MEPMTLSPIGSPPSHQMPGNTNFLPAFLMGESTTPVTPRTNTLSPNNARNLAFGNFFLLINPNYVNFSILNAHNVQGNNNNIITSSTNYNNNMEET